MTTPEGPNLIPGAIMLAVVVVTLAVTPLIIATVRGGGLRSNRFCWNAAIVVTAGVATIGASAGWIHLTINTLDLGGPNGPSGYNSTAGFVNYLVGEALILVTAAWLARRMWHRKR